MNWKKFLKIAALTVVLVGIATGLFTYRLLRQVPGQYFDSAGVKIHYTDEGAGEPVILVHGYTANADINWRLPGIHQKLKKLFRVVTMDVRGHGLSEKPHDPAKYGMELVNDVERLMDHLKIPRAHIVGYSMGGFITWKFATTHPDRVISAMPCGAAWMPPGDPLEDLANNIHSDLAKHPVLGLVMDLDALGALAKSFKDLAIPEAELRAVKIPVMSLKGGAEEVVLGGGDIKAVFPAFQEIIIPGARHNTVIFYNAFQDALLEFLRAHPDKAMP